jgi:hypothetical protein
MSDIIYFAFAPPEHYVKLVQFRADTEGGKGMDFLRFATGHEDFWKVCIRGGDAFDFARAVLAHGLRFRTRRVGREPYAVFSRLRVVNRPRDQQASAYPI